MMDNHLYELPTILVTNSGFNLGYMMAHITAAAMMTYAARRIPILAEVARTLETKRYQRRVLKVVREYGVIT
ncbi:MAG: hypothetical protein COB04_18260 [Gammaproteobacteria bacterium]|nr:MAG: hypothetical protein COB04_18260 [Gammaproteobacteria bacterium]